MVTWNGPQIRHELEVFLAPRVQAAAAFVRDYIKGKLSENIGSVVPFVASQPGEYPYYWDGTLANSLVSFQGAAWWRAVVASDAVDEHVHPGHHFSGEEEFGHYWDGWAWDWQTGKLVKVCDPKDVEPRPFMMRGLTECRAVVFGILAGTGAGGGAGGAAP